MAIENKQVGEQTRTNTMTMSLLPTSPAVQSLMAGSCAGVIRIMVGHPFDTIKVRLQTMPKPRFGRKPQFTGAFDCARSTIMKEGLSAVYRGAAAPLALSIPAQAVKFWGFNLGKKLVGNGQSNELAAHQLFAAGLISGLAMQIVMVPGERIKCLLQIQRESRGSNKYSGPFDCVRQIYRTEGVRGTFTGLFAGISRDAPYLGIFFMTSEFLIKLMTPRGRTREDVGSLGIGLAGGIAGTISWVVVLPQDCLKSRYVTAPMGTFPRGIRDTLLVTVREESVRVLWRGLTPVVLRAFPTNCSVLWGYEMGMRFFKWCNPATQ